jgi:toxin ParE1/3/4
MSNQCLVISPGARDDLREIYLFGLRNWGQNQSSTYLEKLKHMFWLLIEQPHMGVERPDILPEMRSFALESHIVFYRIQSKSIEVIRVLHARQDPNRHINPGTNSGSRYQDKGSRP